MTDQLIKPKYGEVFRLFKSEVLSKPTLLAILSITAILAGIATQLNWIHEHCADVPFMQNGPGVCKENVLRIYGGGPGFIIAELILLLGLFVLYIRNGKADSAPRVSSNLVFSLAFLALLILLPAFGYSKAIIYITVLLVFGYMFWSLRQESLLVVNTLFPPLSGGVNVEIHKNEIIVKLSGRLVGNDVAEILQLLSWQSYHDIPEKDITVDLSEVEDIDDRGAAIFHYLRAAAVVTGSKISASGFDELPAPAKKIVKHLLDA